MQGFEKILGVTLPAAVTLAAAVLLLAYLYGYFSPLRAGSAPREVPVRRGAPKERLRLIGWIVAWVLATRLFL